MSLNELRNEIEKEAKGSVSSIRKEGSDEEKRILKEADEKAKEILKEAELEAEAIRERIRKEGDANIEMERRSILLRAREEVLEKEISKIRERIESEAKKNYEKILDDAIKRFSQIVQKKEMVVYTGKENMKILKEHGIGGEYEDIDGFVLSSKDNSVSLDATIQHMVESNIDSVKNFALNSFFGELPEARKEKEGRETPKKKTGRTKRTKGR